VKFDVVIGNPPYNEEKVKIYPYFVENALPLAKTVCVIVPDALRGVNKVKGKVKSIDNYPNAFPSEIGINPSVFLLDNDYNSSDVVVDGVTQHIETNEERKERLRARQAEIKANQTRWAAEWNSTETKGSVMVSMAKLAEMVPTAPPRFLQQREGSKFRYFMDNDANIAPNQLMLLSSAIESGRELYVDTWENIKDTDGGKDRYYFPLDMDRFTSKQLDNIVFWLRKYHPICQQELLRHINNAFPIPDLDDPSFGSPEWERQKLDTLGFESMEQALAGVSV